MSRLKCSEVSKLNFRGRTFLSLLVAATVKYAPQISKYDASLFSEVMDKARDKVGEPGTSLFRSYSKHLLHKAMVI